MVVRSLHVAGYRCLLDVSVELGEITVILGANGTGKTNLYRALRLAHACGDGGLARAVVHEGGMDSISYAGQRRGAHKVDAMVRSRLAPVVVIPSSEDDWMTYSSLAADPDPT
jgi:predicted ATPase